MAHDQHAFDWFIRDEIKEGIKVLKQSEKVVTKIDIPISSQSDIRLKRIEMELGKAQQNEKWRNIEANPFESDDSVSDSYLDKEEEKLQIEMEKIQLERALEVGQRKTRIKIVDNEKNDENEDAKKVIEKKSGKQNRENAIANLKRLKMEVEMDLEKERKELERELNRTPERPKQQSYNEDEINSKKERLVKSSDSISRPEQKQRKMKTKKSENNNNINNNNNNVEISLRHSADQVISNPKRKTRKSNIENTTNKNNSDENFVPSLRHSSGNIKTTTTKTNKTKSPKTTTPKTERKAKSTKPKQIYRSNSDQNIVIEPKRKTKKSSPNLRHSNIEIHTTNNNNDNDNDKEET